MDRRRAVLALVVTVPGLGVASAQPLPRSAPARVAVLDDAPPDVRAQFWMAFRKQLGTLGYVEGRDVVYDYRTADGDLSRLDTLAAEIVARKPDVIVVVTTTVALAAKRATAVIPVVAFGPADPVKSGLVESLGRPGGNLTGVSANQAAIAGKWLDLLRELLPSAKSFAYLTDVGNPGEMVVFRELEARTIPLGMSTRAFSGVTAEDVDEAFRAIVAARMDALIVATTASLIPQRRQIVDLAARARLPAIYARPEYTDVGGLVSYGASTFSLIPRGADYVNRILRGAKAGDLPFEMGASFRMVLNMRTARALGITVPSTVRVRADEVVDEARQRP